MSTPLQAKQRSPDGRYIKVSRCGVGLLFCCTFVTILLLSTLKTSTPIVRFQRIDQQIYIQKATLDVDFVISYVNGTDPTWQERYKSVLPPDSFSASRFVDTGEVFFCISSILHNAPWVRNIVIVTQGQTIDLSVFSEDVRHKIRFVDHREIVPPTAWPLFSSLAIETWLWKIPDLAENFIYLNDDMYLWSPINKDDLFVNGRFKLPAKPESPNFFFGADREGYRIGEGNSAQLIKQRFGAIPAVWWHAGYHCSKAGMQAAFEMFVGAANRTGHQKLRNYVDLSEGGDINFISLARMVSIFLNYQVLDTSYTYKSFPSYSPKLDVELFSEKPTVLYLNLQDLAGYSVENRLKVCERFLDMHKDVIEPERAACFCRKEGFGRPCSSSSSS